MRVVIHILVGLMVLAILAGVGYVKIHERTEQTTREQTRQELRRFQQQVHLQTALLAENAEDEDDLNAPPATIDPAWFADSLPMNLLLGSEHPWVEVAGLRDRDLQHPANPIATDESVAAFWYNPYTGVVRGRVPQQVSDSKALELYNDVNDSHLATLFADGALTASPHIDAPDE